MAKKVELTPAQRADRLISDATAEVMSVRQALERVCEDGRTAAEEFRWGALLRTVAFLEETVVAAQRGEWAGCVLDDAFGTGEATTPDGRPFRGLRGDGRSDVDALAGAIDAMQKRLTTWLVETNEFTPTSTSMFRNALNVARADAARGFLRSAAMWAAQLRDVTRCIREAQTLRAVSRGS